MDAKTEEFYNGKDGKGGFAFLDEPAITPKKGNPKS